MSPNPSRTIDRRRGVAKRGGSDPFTRTTYLNSPPSSKFEHGIPKIAGSTGGFWGVLFGSFVVFVLVGVLLWRYLRKRRLNRLARSEGMGRNKGTSGSSKKGRGWGKMNSPEITVNDNEPATSKNQIYGHDAFEASNDGNLSAISLNRHEKPDWSPTTYESRSYLASPRQSTNNLSPIMSPWHTHHEANSGSRVSVESAGLPVEAEDPFKEAEDKGYSHIVEHRAPSPGMPTSPRQ